MTVMKKRRMDIKEEGEERRILRKEVQTDMKEGRKEEWILRKKGY
jgi:hypothetical protein